MTSLRTKRLFKLEIRNPDTKQTTHKLCKNAIEIVKSTNNELFSGIKIVTPAIIYSILTRNYRVKVPYLEYFIIHPKESRS